MELGYYSVLSDDLKKRPRGFRKRKVKIWGGGVFASVGGESEGPEAVGVAVGAAVGGEAEVAGEGGLAFDGTEVGADELVLGDAELVFLEGGKKAVGEGFFACIGEGNGVDAALAEGGDGVFCELPADARLVDSGAAEIGD